MAKVNRTKFYNFVGDVFEHYEQNRSSKERTHSDNGWRLRNKKYGATATFAKLPLTETLEQRPCPLKEGQAGIYILRDSVFPQGFYIGKGKDIYDRIWKHGVKLDGTDKWNKGVGTTENFAKYRELRLEKGLTGWDDVEVAFWFTDKFDELEDQLMGAYEAKYGMYSYYDQKGFLRVGIEKKRKVQKAIVEATSLFELKRQLEEAAIEFKLCRKLLGLQLGACAVESNCAVCDAKTTALKHNNRLNKSIKKLSQTEALVYKEAIPLSDKYFVAIAKDGRLCMGITDNLQTIKNNKLPIEDNAFKTYPLNSFVSHTLRKLTLEN
jgi:hypothetical protein